MFIHLHKTSPFQFRGKRAIGTQKNSRDFLKKIFNGRYGRRVFGLRSVIDAEIKDKIALEIVDYFAEHIEKQQASYRAIFRLQVKTPDFHLQNKKLLFFKISKKFISSQKGSFSFHSHKWGFGINLNPRLQKLNLLLSLQGLRLITRLVLRKILT